LNILFLIKISGLVVGFGIVVMGLIIRGSIRQGFVCISLVFAFLTLMVAIDFAVTGTSLLPVIQEYRMAAQAKAGHNSALDAIWFASRLPLVWVVVLLALYAISRPDRENSKNSLGGCLLVIATYWACQSVLNMTNSTADPDLVILAPAAAVAVVSSTETSHAMALWDHLWRKFHPRKLHEISARELIPLLIIGMVIIPEALASLRAVKLDYLLAMGAKKSVAVSGGEGIVFDILPTDDDDSYNGRVADQINGAVHALLTLGANHEAIANLDYMNPFPALFLAAAPKSVWVWWDFSQRGNVPIGYKPVWQEIIGDACIVTEPKNSPVPQPYYSQPLIKAVTPHLSATFSLVYEDELWKIWKHNDGCATGSRGTSSAGQ
jgi:hypothetical protein